jgi:hypothetical protein
VSYQTTAGWSLLSSGIVTLLLTALPGDDVLWETGLVLAGGAVMYQRRTDGG